MRCWISRGVSAGSELADVATVLAGFVGRFGSSRGTAIGNESCFERGASGAAAGPGVHQVHAAVLVPERAGVDGAAGRLDQRERLPGPARVAGARHVDPAVGVSDVDPEEAAVMAQAGGAPADDPSTKAKEKALATGCINNLKQIVLAARIWANEHKTTLLPLDWLAMKNELPTPKTLTCPGDTRRTKAASWDQFDGSSVSYELPSAARGERDP